MSYQKAMGLIRHVKSDLEKIGESPEKLGISEDFIFVCESIFKANAQLLRRALAELEPEPPEKVNDCPSCGAASGGLIIIGPGDILCDKCAKTVGVNTGEPQHEPRC